MYKIVLIQVWYSNASVSIWDCPIGVVVSHMCSLKDVVLMFKSQCLYSRDIIVQRIDVMLIIRATGISKYIYLQHTSIVITAFVKPAVCLSMLIISKILLVVA